MVKRNSRRGIAKVVYGRTITYILLLVLQLVILYLSVLRYHQSSIFFGSSALVSIIVVLIILNEEINPMYKLAWIIPVMALPVVGTFTYLWIRFQPTLMFMRRNHKRLDGELAGYLNLSGDFSEELKDTDDGGEYLKSQESQADFSALDRDLKSTASFLYNTMHYPVYKNEATQYFPVGEKVFRKILKELGKAEKYIFIEYFIIENGVMWDAIMEVLKVKAAQGVEVRVMYDGTCNFKLLPYSYPRTLEKLGIQCRIFSPIIPILSVHQNNRDHRKILVIDGKVAFTGGVNFADEYINEIDRFGHWKDTAVLVRGEAVRTFTSLFLEMWNLGEKNVTEDFGKYLLPQSTEEEKPSANSKAKGYVIPYGDSPLDKENTGEQVYFDIINQAERYVYIMTPYLILDNEMLTVLKAAAKRGVDVRIVMPHIPDKKYAFYLARSFYPELIGAGVKMYEYIPGFVHAKVFLSDDKKAVVGTINLDYRSLYLHFECGLYMYETEAVEDIREDFDNTFEKCMQFTMEKYKEINVIKRGIGRIFRLFAPLM
ncbi:MAG: cardiolipin synthase [Lachnospiraceae bacterium]